MYFTSVANRCNHQVLQLSQTRKKGKKDHFNWYNQQTSDSHFSCIVQLDQCIFHVIS